MPVHLVECPECGEYEVLTYRIHDPVPLDCPVCGCVGERRFGVPRAVTKSTIMIGAKLGGDQFVGDPEAEELYIHRARRRGANINGRMYVHALAAYPGDPEAWVADRDEARALLRRRGWTCEELGVKGPEIEPQRVAVAEDIVDRKLDEMVASGEIAPHERDQKREEAADRLLPARKKGTYKRPKPEKIKGRS